MRKNVGGIDRKLRMAVGAALIVSGVFYQPWLALIGLVAFGTAVIGWCPPYAVLGISTCKKQNTAS